MRAIRGMVLLTAMAAALPAAAQTERVVTVDARSAPWSTRMNPKLGFGIGDGRAPTMVLLGVGPGTKVRFAATGTTTTMASGMSFGPDGQRDFQTGTEMAGSGTYFPSRYVDRRALPLYVNQLMGAFVDADGVVVGAPFAIGSAAEARVPEGAFAVTLGINDDRLAENAGSLRVVVTTLGGTVTVE